MSNDEPLRIWWNKNLHGKISPMKLAAHAAHAALHAYGIKYTHPIVVLSAGKAKIEAMPITIHDEGRTELSPGTLTTGVERPWSADNKYEVLKRVEMTPPTGWYMFGSHVDDPTPLEFYGSEFTEDGMPMWERPRRAGE